MFVGKLHDVVSDTADSFLCVFDSGFVGIGWKVRFSFACNQQQADYAMAAHSPGLQRFAVVGRITSVKKLDDSASGETSGQSSGPEFAADGRLEDSLFVGDYFDDW